jgi:predicted peroxiredoxin
MTATPLGLLLRTGGHEAAHYALVLAAGAAAVGRPVVLFATNGGLALFRRGTPLRDDAREAHLAARGVAGIGVLWDAVQELGVRFVACEAGLRTEDLDPSELVEGVEVAGVVTFLEAVGTGNMLAL